MIFFLDDYSRYISGKHAYEFNGQYEYDLADAYSSFEKANEFWDSEDYSTKHRKSYLNERSDNSELTSIILVYTL